MNSYERIPSLAHRHHSFVFSKVFSLALTVTLLTFNTQAFAEHIKVAYAALSAGQIAVWMAKEGGYLAKSRHRCGGHLHSSSRRNAGVDRG